MRVCVRPSVRVHVRVGYLCVDYAYLYTNPNIFCELAFC